VQFDVELDRAVTGFDVDGEELQWMGDATVRFSVYDRDISDEDDDSLNTSVPFQVAYQGPGKVAGCGVSRGDTPVMV
jgi:hypothetical protein